MSAVDRRGREWHASDAGTGAESGEFGDFGRFTFVLTGEVACGKGLDGLNRSGLNHTDLQIGDLDEWVVEVEGDGVDAFLDLDVGDFIPSGWRDVRMPAVALDLRFGVEGRAVECSGNPWGFAAVTVVRRFAVGWNRCECPQSIIASGGGLECECGMAGGVCKFDLAEGSIFKMSIGAKLNFVKIESTGGRCIFYFGAEFRSGDH